MTPTLTADQVLEGLGVARGLIDRYAPAGSATGAQATIDALVRSPAAVDALALVGTVGLARLQSTWRSLGPGTIPAPASSSEEALARIEGRQDARIDRRDAEIAAFSALTAAALHVGLEAFEAGLPWIMASLQG